MRSARNKVLPRKMWTTLRMIYARVSIYLMRFHEMIAKVTAAAAAANQTKPKSIQRTNEQICSAVCCYNAILYIVYYLFLFLTS